MGLFHRKKEPEPVPATPEQLELFGHLDRQVALVVRDGTINIDGMLHACVTQAALEKAAGRLRARGTYTVTVLGQVLDGVLQQEGLHGVVLCGLAGNEMDFLLTREALSGMKDVVDSFCILYTAARGAMPQEKARELMAPKTVYFLGELPKTGKTGERFGFAAMKRQGQDGGTYEAVKCFLTPESAEQFNGENHPVTPARVGALADFLEGTFALVIEPHRNYWLELGAEHARRGG